MFIVGLLAVMVFMSTCPVNAQQDEVARLNKEIAALKLQNEQLKVENQSLRKMLGQVLGNTDKPVSQNVLPGTPATQEIKKDTSAESGYWITTSSSKRHNKNCRYYKGSNGRFCGPNDGIACKICGG
ncbi:MAG: hypothetical protein A2283_24335 [Lentisphaerae bacterium RIFOXYA12_FULL_48_11]|nr:MAG: hypothetical protein A2283_24335 [Lentisphaerae bacterium RIFOXYA12_FULL_48_11]